MADLRFVMAEGTAPNLDIEKEFLKGQDVDIRITPLDTADAVGRETVDADAVIVGTEPMSRPFIERFGPKVKIIGRAGIGLDAIDMDAAREHGVAVFHTPDYATEEVATHALALILALNRRIVEGDAVARSNWPAYESLLPVKPLSEQVVGIVGLGRIGRAVIERLVPFRPTIIGFDPFVDSPVPGVERAGSLDDVLTRSDIVTLHLPVTPETVKVIGRREIGLLRPGALLINVSRGRLIDEEALVEALADDRIRAGLDVVTTEPPPRDAPILTAPNALLSPHFAWYSDSSQRRVRTETLAGVLNYLRDEPLQTGRLVVDPRVSA
ncbi:MAG: C-terminal binding protein [Candidatus Dormiibacterota bacterium]